MGKNKVYEHKIQVVLLQHVNQVCEANLPQYVNWFEKMMLTLSSWEIEHGRVLRFCIKDLCGASEVQILPSDQFLDVFIIGVISPAYNYESLHGKCHRTDM